MWQRLRELKLSTAGRHVLLVVGQVLLLGLMTAGGLSGGREQTLRQLQDLKSIRRDFSPATLDQLTLADGLIATDAERQRLEDVFVEVQARAHHHLRVAMFFGTDYSIGIFLATFTSVVSAACLFLISLRGWLRANPYLLNVFLTMAAATTFYVAVPTIYRQRENIIDNKNLYIQYDNLENELLTYMATGEDSAGNRREVSSYLHEIDRRMAAMNDFVVGFEHEKVPTYQDFQKLTEAEGSGGP